MIVFDDIRWKNFLSTGNSFTHVKITDSQSHLVVGANGAGKSTMLDALCFVLFNKPFRKISKSQLVNSINERETVVEIEFRIGGVQYKVIRGIKPNVFEIHRNGKLLDQDAASKDQQKYLEQSILKFNFKSFTQVVILGSSTFVPFMQLGASVRREVIEDLLDIQIFSRMNNILKDRMKDARETLKDCEHDLAMSERSMELQRKTISNMEKMSGSHKAKMERRIGEINTRMEENHDEVDEFTKKISRMQDIQKEYDEMRDMRVKIQSNLDKAERDLKFYWENDSCPTCNQVVADKTAMIEGAQGRQKRFIEGLNVITDALNRGNGQIKELKTYADKINANNHEFKSLQDEMNRLLMDVNRETPNIDAEKVLLEQYEGKHNDIASNCAEVHKDHDNLKVVGTLLRDSGIKSKIISKFVPIINKSINKYLQSMDTYFNFTLDEEFNEVIRSRYRDAFSYASFSEGEKQKIDLALLFTWRDIAKLKNSASTNLLILDEVFDSSLDDQATDELLKILRGLGENVNLFVISHKGELLLDKFEKTLRFEKANDFSKLAAS
jgi:DNA repair exonuclease SbcCD ATPase subunit|tara:strand:+ start:4835 stop:6496 length:1662 start_codon:yes stop_codon:yes gene_type:complete